jgi:hypothetical protein
MSNKFIDQLEDILGGNNPFSTDPAQDCIEAIESIRRSRAKIIDATKKEDTQCPPPKAA